jgi:hypothetical protein
MSPGAKIAPRMILNRVALMMMMMMTMMERDPSVVLPKYASSFQLALLSF